VTPNPSLNTPTSYGKRCKPGQRQGTIVASAVGVSSNVRQHKAARVRAAYQVRRSAPGVRGNTREAMVVGPRFNRHQGHAPASICGP
jgi:hypothetical protein